MKNSAAIHEFKVEKAIYEELAKDEKKILPILVKAARQLAEIYLDQERGYDKYPGANLYPPDISDKEIEQATKKNPAILSPFTVVEKEDSQLKSTPYHIKYQRTLKQISQLLLAASKIAKNQSFARYLATASQSLISGNYKQLDLAWLATENSTLQFLIGPYERNLDHRFFVKMAYLAFVGIKDSYFTKKAESIRDIFFTTVGDKPHRFTSPSQVQICSIRNIYFAGFLARALISTEHIPSDDQTIRESGSRLMGYLSTMDYKFNNYLYPIFKVIFQKTFQESYSTELLRRANYYLMLVYGLARQLHRYEGARERLKELFPILDEVSSMVSGLQHCKHLVMKGVLDQKELEAMIIMHICWSFSEWVFAKKSQLRVDYLRGDALSLNFYFTNEALRELGGISWPNFSRIFFTIETLSTIFVRLLAEGTYKEVENFIKQNLSYEIFRTFDSKLSKIHPQH